MVKIFMNCPMLDQVEECIAGDTADLNQYLIRYRAIRLRGSKGLRAER